MAQHKPSRSKGMKLLRKIADQNQYMQPRKKNSLEPINRIQLGLLPSGPRCSLDYTCTFRLRFQNHGETLKGNLIMVSETMLIQFLVHVR